MQNRSVPTDLLLPHVFYQNITAAGEWLTRVFGFQENYRYGDPVSGIQMFLGKAYIMVTRARPGSSSPAQLGSATQSLTIFVADVDAHYGHAREAGANIVEELNETIYGERQYGALDLGGHRWLFSRHARDVNPEDWGAMVSSQ